MAWLKIFESLFIPQQSFRMFMLLLVTCKTEHSNFYHVYLTVSQKQLERANFQTFIYRSFIQITNVYIYHSHFDCYPVSASTTISPIT